MIYRVDYYDDNEGSQGYDYFGNKVQVRKAIKEATDNDVANHIGVSSEPTPKTKKQMISLLNMWGGHPNNG